MPTNRPVALTESLRAGIVRHAVNRTTSVLVYGISLTHDEADDLGEETIDWMRREFALRMSTDADGVHLVAESAAEQADA